MKEALIVDILVISLLAGVVIVLAVVGINHDAMGNQTSLNDGNSSQNLSLARADMGKLKIYPNFSDIEFSFYTNYTQIMVLYSNGTIWVKEGQEQKLGEQFAKISIAYNSYLNGYCRGRNENKN